MTPVEKFKSIIQGSGIDPIEDIIGTNDPDVMGVAIHHFNMQSIIGSDASRSADLKEYIQKLAKAQARCYEKNDPDFKHTDEISSHTESRMRWSSNGKLNTIS